MIRVLIVDDSALVRRLISTALEEADDIEIAGQARDGLEAVELVDQLKPDAVTLDIEMPRLDGLGALKRIREKHHKLPIIMFSTLTERGASQTLEALGAGASDYVTKPSNTGSIRQGMEAVRDQIVPKLRALVGTRQLIEGRHQGLPAAPKPEVRTRGASTGRPEILVIGCSTGGPDALTQVIAELPGDLRVPVVVVQHMPPVFTAMFAERLDKAGPLSVREAVDGDVLQKGQVLLAPGDFHLRLAGGPTTGVRVKLDQGPQVQFVRPAVDVLFSSTVDIYRGNVLAVVLTGMGQDGLEGVRRLSAAGAHVIVQDEDTSVVWGMPGVVAQAGLANAILPLTKIAGAVATALR